MLKEKIHSDSFKSRHRQGSHWFSRNRVLTFPRLLVAQINRMSKSLSVEVSRFIALVSGNPDRDLSKQAFSAARQGLKASAYIELNDDLIREYYPQSRLTYHYGYLPLGIDGSLIQLPNFEELIEAFGQCPGGRVPMAMARVSRLFDIEHRMIIDSRIEPYEQSEQAMARAHVDKWVQLVKDQPALLIFDRNYPSFFWCAYLGHLGLDFLIRCPRNFCAELEAFAQSEEMDQLVAIDLTRKGKKVNKELRQISPMPRTLPLRMIKVELSTGETEYLLCSVCEQEKIPTHAFEELYHLRWGSETDYDYAKNALQLENISSRKPESLKQEFHALTLTQNMANLLIEQAQEQLDQEASQAKNAYPYQINRAVAFGLIKDQIPLLFFGEESLEILTKRLIKKIKRRRNPIRLNRSFRRKTLTSHKFHHNKRPVI